ncbi:MAG: LCP family protein [Elusimicrobia bacterium]|nr:LCP family protein [Elusimicrobiota bacterium]
MKLKLEHIVLGLIVVSVAAAMYFSFKSPLTRAFRNGQMINGLLIGTDLVDNSRHADTLIFLSYAPATRFLNIISIPRDTRFTQKGARFRKINELYAFNYKATKNEQMAAQETTRAVEQIFNGRVAVPYYLQINYESFRKFIDLIGGVTIDIDESMNHDDTAGDLHIHFEPGRHHFDGRQALEYVRYRGPAGDIGRVFRQQRFLKATMDRFKNPLTMLRLPQIIATVTRDITTNLTVWDILAATLEIKDLRPENIRFAQLPGTSKNSYWETDADNCRGLFDQIVPSTGTVVAAGPLIRVEVWNASGINKLADKVNWMLRKQGYDVIESGTYSVVQKKTLIKDLTGNLRAAQKIANIVGCGEVITRFDNKRYVDISVTLGEDCKISDTDKQSANKH